MNIPKELQHLARCFSYSNVQEHGTAEEWIASRVTNCLSVKERKVVNKFLNDLLSGSHTDDELTRIYDKLPFGYWVEPRSGVRWFFTKIRDMSQ